MVQNTQFHIPTSFDPELTQQAPQEIIVPPSPEVVQYSWQHQPEEMPAFGHMNHDPVLARRFYGVVSTMETIPDARLDEITFIAGQLESYRASATEDNLHRSALQVVRELIKPPTKSLNERLIDEEALRSGKVFLRPPFTKESPIDEDEAEKSMGIHSRRFWYFNNYWYYEVEFIGFAPIVISYQIVNNEVYKTVNGSAAPLVAGEVDSLHAAVKSSHDIVRHGMYPVIDALDDAIADLTTDDGESLDHLDYLDRLKH